MSIISNFDWFYVPKISIRDLVEITVLAILLYNVFLWFKRTRAWTLFKGILIVLVFMGLAALFQLQTILWIGRNMINVGIIAVIILFQPELRRALEELGRKNFIPDMLNVNERQAGEGIVSEETVKEIVAASIDMSKAKTGALIVIEKNVALGEYEATGISVDAAVSKQLLVNIFEKNTPLHDGAVIIRNNRVLAATCYLPLTQSMDLNKELGTRHRAAIGLSEVSDSITIIVSEETGAISVAKGGIIKRNLDAEMLKRELLYDGLTEEEAMKEKPTRRNSKRKKGGKYHE